MSEAESADDPMARLRERYPEMTPVKGAPTLFLLNGCGLAVYGNRDRDPETRTYVKTHCLCFIFFPVLCIGAYRVADAGNGGWYFIGKQPLSALAKGYNCLLLLAVLGLAGTATYNEYTKSPEYIAARQMETAAQELEDRKFVSAVRTYGTVALGSTSQTAPAQEAACKVYRERLDEVPPAEAVELFKFAMQREKSGAPLLALGEPFKLSMALARKWEVSDPRKALELLDATGPAPGKDPLFDGQREELLKLAVAKHPGDLALAAQLAALLEEHKDYDGAANLLLPHQKKLADTDGARILGQWFARQDRFDEADGLLKPYCDARLKRLHQAEQACDDVYKAQSDRLLGQLRAGAAGDAWYRDYEKLNDSGKQDKVDQYILANLKNNIMLKDAQAKLIEEAKVVPVALDLGIVTLHRAQSMQPAERKQTLENAEKIFLAIQGVASESDEFRIHYAQVLYWLGKHKEGRAKFDEFLEAKKNAFEAQMQVASLLREVGANSECRALCEKAWEVEKDEKNKQGAARLRSLCKQNLEDEILWLSRCNQTDLQVKASLHSTRAEKAMTEGRHDDAIRDLRAAIEIYKGIPKSASALNNSALLYLDLFEATGDAADFRTGTDLLEEAQSLEPSDSILLSNLSHLQLSRALLDLLNGKVDFKLLRTAPALKQLSHLYHDAAGHAELNKRLASHPEVAKCIANLSKLLLLAPKNTRAYDLLATLHDRLENVPALKRLHRQAIEANLDLDDARAITFSFYDGHEDEVMRGKHPGELERAAKLLASLPSEAQGPTRTLAVETYAETALTGEQLGLPCDLGKLQALLETELARAGSRRLRRMLDSILLCRSTKQLAQEDASFAALLKARQRKLSLKHALALGLERFPGLRDKAAANPDIKRIVASTVTEVRRVPKLCDSADWAVLRHFEPDIARELAGHLRQNETELLRVQIEVICAPYSVSSCYELVWLYAALGQPAKGEAVLKECAAQGVELP